MHKQDVKAKNTKFDVKNNSEADAKNSQLANTKSNESKDRVHPVGYTVKQVAKALSLTKMAVRHRMDAIPGFNEKYVTRQGKTHTIRIAPEGVRTLVGEHNSRIESHKKILNHEDKAKSLVNLVQTQSASITNYQSSITALKIASASTSNSWSTTYSGDSKVWKTKYSANTTTWKTKYDALQKRFNDASNNKAYLKSLLAEAVANNSASSNSQAFSDNVSKPSNADAPASSSKKPSFWKKFFGKI